MIPPSAASPRNELVLDSRDLLDRVGLRPGHAVIDLGCGPRGILDLLAERVAPAGRVVGLDADRPSETVESPMPISTRMRLPSRNRYDVGPDLDLVSHDLPGSDRLGIGVRVPRTERAAA
jgi:FtsJ-like methyltransferase